MPRSLCIGTLICLAAWPASADWPQFRGPDGQGHAVGEGLPLTWSETENIAWKTPVEGLGWSSPVIQGDQIWLTTAVDDGHSLRAMCFDRGNGRLLHNVEVFHKDDPGPIHTKNSHASPTPLLEGDRIYVHFGAHGTSCLAADGRVLWRTNELEYNHRHGPAGSPVLYGDLLIVSCDGTDVQFVAALDKNTGQVRWKTDRHGPMAYSTPLLIQVGGDDQLISTGGDQVVAYEPSTGQEIWRCRYDGYSLVPRPVHAQGLVVVCSGFNTPSMYAIRPDGQGDVTESHVAWTIRSAVPHNPSPLVVGDELYFVSDRGIATCVDLKTGQEHWQERLGGNFSASPLHADGGIYFLDEDGRTTVVGPGRQFKPLAVNQVDGRALASLAIAGQAIYLRTDSHLYRIEAAGAPGK